LVDIFYFTNFVVLSNLKKIENCDLKLHKYLQSTNKQTTMAGVIKSNGLDLSKVTFSDVKTDTHGRKMVYVNFNNGKLMIQTPKMYAPNGIKRWRKPDAINNKDDKFELELSFYGDENTNKNSQEIREFREKLEGFDKMIKEKVVEKAKEWLSMPKLDMNTLESVMYTSMVRVPHDKEGNQLPYPSRVRVKIDRDMDAAGNYTGRFLSNKKFKTEVFLFDESKERIDLNEENAEDAVPKGSQMICIMELVYLSLSKTTISTKWKLVQGKAFRNKDTITGYAMLDDNEQDDLDTEGEAAEGVAAEGAQVDEEDDVVEHAEESDEEEEEEEVKVAPAPVKAKGRVKRTVA
jgi:hypothetical protein